MLEHQPRSFLELSLVYLFHGPKAQDNLPKSALVADISNIDTIREVVADFLNLPTNMLKKQILIGPLDEISSRSIDVLLKPLEEHPSHIDLYLWCRDIASVKSTLVSRCFLKWFPGPSIFTQEELDFGVKVAQSNSIVDIIKISLVKDLNLKNVLEVALQKNPNIWVFVKTLFTRESILPTEFVSAMVKRW
jgi:hypothetical protein